MQQHNEIIIQSSELQILLNLMARDTIVLDYPLYDLKMVHARPSKDGYRINVLIIYPHLGLSPANDQSDYLRLLSCQNFPKYCLNHKGRIYLKNFNFFISLISLIKINCSNYSQEPNIY